MTKSSITWLIGGPQGSGVDTAASVFAQACAFAGLHVFGNREYYSNIMGKHSYSRVRIGSEPLTASLDAVDVLATFDAETAFRHAREISDSGALLFDPDLAETRTDAVATLESPVRRQLREFFTEHEASDRLADLVELLGRRGVRLVPVPIKAILAEVQRAFSIEQSSKLARMVNVVAVGASLGLLNVEAALLERALRRVFQSKAAIGEMNLAAARRAYEWARAEQGEALCFPPMPRSAEADRLLVTGTQVAAMGKLAAGCRFQTYYPISPATDESVYLEAHERLREGDGHPDGPACRVADGGQGIVVVQTEDELAAIAMASGAALTGVRAATATSGPGFCLMVEGLGWAGANEVPLVVTLYQRCGPSTGMPTRHEQGDLRFVLHAGHGSYPCIVLASGDLEEIFYDTFKAFNYAERYQLPVVHLLDKAMASTTATVRRFDSNAVKIDRGIRWNEESGPATGRIGDAHGDGVFDRFQFTETGVSPRAVLGQRGGIFWNTGDEHDEAGHITEDPILRVAMMEKRMKKLDLALREIPTENQAAFHGDSDADVVVVSWGSTKGALLEAIGMLQAERYRLGFLQVRLMNPFPSERIRRCLSGRSLLIGVEMNYSAQLCGLLREKTGIRIHHRIVKYNGRPMSSSELAESLRAVIDGRASRREVLTHGI